MQEKKKQTFGHCAMMSLQMRLSETGSVAIKMPLKGRDGQPVQAVLTQQEFERMSADLFRRARLPLDEACWQVCNPSRLPSCSTASDEHSHRLMTLLDQLLCNCQSSPCSMRYFATEA